MRFTPHSCNGGANFSLYLESDNRAWVLQNEPTGPELARLPHGRRRPIVAARFQARDVRGKVAFVSPRDGWLAGQRLLRTVDGGRSWQIQPLPAPHGYGGRLVLLTAPRFFGRKGVLAGQFGSGKPVIGFYRTVDRGRSWRLLATLPGSVPGAFPQFVLSAASASTSWLLTAGSKPAVHVTRDGGRHWSSHPLAQKLYAPVALSARVAAASDFHGIPYITRDGGRNLAPSEPLAGRGSTVRASLQRVVGELIAGRYELEELVGSGGMSSVYRAHDRLLERTVALKILHEQFTRGRRLRRALSPRGAGRRAAGAPEHRHGDRPRRAGRAAVHRLRVRRRR